MRPRLEHLRVSMSYQLLLSTGGCIVRDTVGEASSGVLEPGSRHRDRVIQSG